MAERVMYYLAACIINFKALKWMCVILAANCSTGSCALCFPLRRALDQSYHHNHIHLLWQTFGMLSLWSFRKLQPSSLFRR